MFEKFSIKRQARKYKYMLEKTHVYPYPAAVNNSKYYLIDYTKAKKVTGNAVITLDQEIAADAREAHRLLFPFYELTAKMRDEGRMRAGINIDFFRKPLELMDEHWQESLRPGYNLIQQTLTMQLTYRKTYDEFQSLLQELEDQRRSITSEDVTIAEESAAMLDVLQYQIVHSLGAGTSTLKNWIAEMKTHDLWEKLTKAQQVFYQQMLKNEELMLEESKNMPVVRHDNFDKMLKLNKEKMKSFKRKEQKEDEAALRHP